MRAYLPAQLSRRRSALAHRYRYVFVVTYGRSGSTLLMGLLNTIPGYRIRGENLNALYRLYQADAAVSQAHRKHGGPGSRVPSNAWYGAASWRTDTFRATLLDSFIRNVLCPEPGDRVLGFKEVRYTHDHMQDLSDYLDFLRTAFPECRIVFNHRVPDDVAKSAWWANTPRALERLKAADERLRAIPGDDRHFHFDFDAIDDSLDNIRELFAWLGEPMDEEKVRRTLATRHSYAPSSDKAPPAGPPPPATAARSRRAAKRARRIAKRVLTAARLR